MIQKYNRTFHFPWSAGLTNDDKVAKTVDTLLNTEIIISEKLDGSNFCMANEGCFARSHNGPPTHLSFNLAKSYYASIKHKIPESVVIYLEYCYAKHSISL